MKKTSLLSPFLSLGFRPFFLLAAIYSIFSLTYFILLLSGQTDFLPSYFDPISWHQHEMIFGFILPVIVGFLFTAVKNWTNKDTPKNFILLAIVAWWIAGRFAVFYSENLPHWLVIFVDSSFAVVAAIGIAPALISSKNKKNFLFLAILFLFAALNLAAHFSAINFFESEKNFMLIALDVTMLTLAIIGGRVIPFFTERALMIEPIKRVKLLEISSLASIALLIIFELLTENRLLIGGILAIAAIVNGARFTLWQRKKIWKNPLLWILHLGYFWLICGLTFKAAILLFDLDQFRSPANHAITAGAISTLILGMMARVSLGHTGRKLEVGFPMVAAFFLVTFAAIIRVFLVAILPDDYFQTILTIAATFWILAFTIFVLIYAPILVKKRADENLK